jgi:hypothetical protein
VFESPRGHSPYFNESFSPATRRVPPIAISEHHKDDEKCQQDEQPTQSATNLFNHVFIVVLNEIEEIGR